MKSLSVLSFLAFCALSVGVTAAPRGPVAATSPAAALSAASDSSARADSTARGGKHRESERNVMLNGESASGSRPREIATGLPGDDSGMEILEDGQQLAFQRSPYPYYHWAGGNSYRSQSLKSIEETALSTNVVSFAMDSWTALGTDEVHGNFSAQTSNYGQIRGDVNVNGPLGRKWYFTAGVFSNLDPGSVYQPSKPFLYNMQIYKAGLTKRWKGGEASLLYKYSVNRDPSNGYADGPFWYEGKGKVKAYNGFRLGRDSFMPKDDRVELMDEMDGTMRTLDLSEGNIRRIHDVSLLFSHRLGEWDLSFNLHASGAENASTANVILSGIEEIEAGKDKAGNAVTLPDGTPYAGLIQVKGANWSRTDFLHAYATFSAVRKTAHHRWLLALNDRHVYHHYLAASNRFAHTLEASPKRIYKDGKSSWTFNTAAQYYSSHGNLPALYLKDEWDISRSLSLTYGLRGEVQILNEKHYANLGDETRNTRTSGFYFRNGVARAHGLHEVKPAGVALLSPSLRVASGLYLKGLYLRAAMAMPMTSYGSARPPADRPLRTQLGRFGLVYDNPWLSLSAMGTYIGTRGNNTLINFTREVSGVSETVQLAIRYGINTWGFTVDGTLHKGGANLHLMATWQDPRYYGLKETVQFSDGPFRIDFSDKVISGMVRFLAEIDPSYSWEHWRVWASIRYYGRQYANKSNTAWFEGHWETFAGVDWKSGRHWKVSLNVINPLFQTGAKGNLALADMVEDISFLNHYLISGFYIRPFTATLSVNYRF